MESDDFLLQFNDNLNPVHRFVTGFEILSYTSLYSA